MAQKTEQANAVVTMDGTSAKQELEKMTSKAKELRTELKKLEEAGDLKGFREVQKQLKDVTDAQRQLKNQTFDVNQVMKNLNTTSLKNLEKAYRSLAAEIKGTERNAEGLEEKIRQSKAIKNEINTLKSHYNDLGGAQESFFSKASNGFNKYAGVVAGASASFAGLLLAGKAMVKEFETFEDASANLSSLTGLKGNDLKFMEDAAKQMSVSSKEGVKFTQSADQILNAMTVIGSVKAELLKDKDALKQVTEEGLVLAAAAKMETGPALESLGNIMNQFNEPASGATKYINVLAAGSKEGAATISMLSEAFVKAGTVLKMGNISIEQSTAIFETLADKGLKGADAGTALRGVMLKLQSGTDEFNPKVVGLSKALENLANANLSVEQRTKMFGQEGVVAGSILIDNRQRVNELTRAVTGTNTAYEQARINTSTHSAQMAQATNQFKIQAIELGQRLAPVLTFSTNVGTKFLKLMMNFPTIVKENRTLFIALTAAMVALSANKIKNIALSAMEHLSLQKGIGLRIKDKIALEAQIFMEEFHRISMLKGAAATNIFTIAANGLKAAWATSPLGMIAVGAGLVFGAFSALNSKTEEVTEKARGFAAAQSEISEKLVEEKSKLLASIGQYADYKTNMESRKSLIETMNSSYGEYLTNLLTEKSTNVEIAAAINQVNAALENKVKYQAYNDELVQVIKDQLKTERLIKAFSAPDRTKYATQQAFDMAYQTWEATGKANFAAGKKALADLDLEKKKILDEMTKISSLIPKTKPEGTGGDNDPQGGGSGNGKDKQEKQKGAYEALTEEISKLTQEYQNLITKQNSGIAVDANVITSIEKQIVAKTAQKKAIDKLVESKIGEAKEGEKEKTQWQKLGEEINTYNDKLMDLITRRQNGEQVSDKELERIANEIKLRTTAQKKIQETSKELTTMFNAYDQIVKRSKEIEESANADAFMEQAKLLKQFKDGKLSQAQFEEQMDKAKENADNKAMIREFFLLQNSLKNFKGSTDERLKLEEQFQKAKEKMLEKDVKNTLAAEEKKKKAAEKRRAVWKKGEEIVINAASDFANNTFAKNQNKEMAAVDEASKDKREKLKADQENGLISQAEYDAQMAQLDLDDNKRKAEIEQKFALWKIAVNTAVAVAKAVAESPTTFGLPFSAFALAEGVAQAAVASISPQFRDGNIPDTIPVMGATDGITYDAVPGGMAKTGFYNRPTLLVSEDARGGRIGEMVISARDLENKAVMQHAQAIAGITSGQYRNGNTPQTVTSGGSSANLERLLQQLVDNTANSYNFRDLDDTLVKVQKKKAFEKAQFKG